LSRNIRPKIPHSAITFLHLKVAPKAKRKNKIQKYSTFLPLIVFLNEISRYQKLYNKKRKEKALIQNIKVKSIIFIFILWL
jgi:hypothetical protein